jgi:hypothetical protein
MQGGTTKKPVTERDKRGFYDTKATGHDPARKKTGATKTTFGSTYDHRKGSTAKKPAPKKVNTLVSQGKKPAPKPAPKQTRTGSSTRGSGQEGTKTESKKGESTKYILKGPAPKVPKGRGTVPPKLSKEAARKAKILERKKKIAAKKRGNAEKRTSNKTASTRKRLDRYVAKTKRPGSKWSYEEFGKKFGSKQ